MTIKIYNFCDFIMSRDIYKKPSDNEEKDKKSNSKLIIIIVIISIVFVANFIILYKWRFENEVSSNLSNYQCKRIYLWLW